MCIQWIDVIDTGGFKTVVKTSVMSDCSIIEQLQLATHGYIIHVHDCDVIILKY